VRRSGRDARSRSLYSGTEAARLWRRPQWLAGVATLISALSTGGCTYRLETMFSKGESDVQQSGAIGGSAVATPSETDLAYTRAAAAEALAHGARDASVPWENPHTGAGGNITPLTVAYREGAATCRGFLASYIRGEKQAWLHGAACRTADGKWEVKTLKLFNDG
jgi:surface antigen